MTCRVHVSSPSTPFALLVRLIEENRIGVIPVVDQTGIPVGVVSDADLSHQRQQRAESMTADGIVASDVMASPPITISGDASLADAASRMRERDLRHLVVVDARGKIVGIVSRSDLVQVFRRSDEDVSGG